MFKNTGRIETMQTRSPKPRKLNEEEVSLIKSKIDEDPTITLKEVRDFLEAETGKRVPLSTISRTTEMFFYTLKRIHEVPERRNSPETVERRYSYALNFMNFNPNKIVFVDESGF
jgi:transposase